MLSSFQLDPFRGSACGDPRDKRFRCDPDRSGSAWITISCATTVSTARIQGASVQELTDSKFRGDQTSYRFGSDLRHQYFQQVRGFLGSLLFLPEKSLSDLGLCFRGILAKIKTESVASLASFSFKLFFPQRYNTITISTKNPLEYWVSGLARYVQLLDTEGTQTWNSEPVYWMTYFDHDARSHLVIVTCNTGLKPSITFWGIFLLDIQFYISYIQLGLKRVLFTISQHQFYSCCLNSRRVWTAANYNNNASQRPVLLDSLKRAD